MTISRCLFCGGDSTSRDHLTYCDGRQGRQEAAQPPDFDGATYEPTRDRERLHAQLARVRAALRDRQWHTLSDLARTTGDPEASISARIRDLRKAKFGGHCVARRYVDRGLFEYQLQDGE